MDNIVLFERRSAGHGTAVGGIARGDIARVGAAQLGAAHVGTAAGGRIGRDTPVRVAAIGNTVVHILTGGNTAGRGEAIYGSGVSAAAVSANTFSSPAARGPAVRGPASRGPALRIPASRGPSGPGGTEGAAIVSRITSRAMSGRLAGALLPLRAVIYLLCLLAGTLAWHRSAHAELAVTAPAPTLDESANGAHSATAVLAGGCFWGVQGVFAHVNGVTRVVSGYAGGSRRTANYEQVSEGDTGHAESVEITYDPTRVTYGQLLQVFFSVVQDPTLRDAQGPDEGTQYRSAIFPLSDSQRRVATAYIAQLGQARVFQAPIVTGVEPYKGFYRAEDYHQDYLMLHPDDPYIAHNDMPKIAELHKRLPALYRADPSVASTASR